MCIFIQAIRMKNEKGNDVTVKVSATDIVIDDSDIGIPFDAMDTTIWDFCQAVFEKCASHSHHLGFPNIEIARVYQLLQPLFDTAQSNQLDVEEEE